MSLHPSISPLFHLLPFIHPPLFLTYFKQFFLNFDHLQLFLMHFFLYFFPPRSVCWFLTGPLWATFLNDRSRPAVQCSIYVHWLIWNLVRWIFCTSWSVHFLIFVFATFLFLTNLRAKYFSPLSYSSSYLHFPFMSIHLFSTFPPALFHLLVSLSTRSPCTRHK